ncbi:MAG: OmpA family protein [Deltaproteobacteria bacterium]|nr:OmpA family protein [Deltaproteobacteria bacterium]
MRKISMLLTVAVLLAALAAPVSAENRAGAVTVSPFVGGYVFDCFQCLEDDWYFGARAGYNFTKNLGIEAMFGYVPTESEAYGYQEEDVDVFRYGADLLYHFNPDGNFVPFIAVGFGGIRIDDPSDRNDRDRGMLDYGLGAKFFISEDVAFRADVRHDLFYEDDELEGNLEYTFGLTFQFGGDKHVTASSYSAAAQPAEQTVTPAPAPRAAAPKAAAPLPPAAVKAVPKVVLIELVDTHFEHDQSRLTPAGKEVLLKNIDTLNANPDIDILIAGYASASGTQEYNQDLSEKRATTVRKALIEGGIAPERLTKIGYGENRPANFEAYPVDIESRAAKSNRRVLFTIVVD